MTSPTATPRPREATVLAHPRFDSAVVLSPFFWNFRDDIPGTTHYIAKELARQYPTLLVEPIPQWNPSSEQFRYGRLARAVTGPRTTKISEHFSVFHRGASPGARIGAIRDWDLRRNARALRRTLRELGFRNTLLWHSFPYWSEPLVEAIEYRAMVYQCLDFTSREEEQRLNTRAQAVFCVSETLVDKHRSLNPNVAQLPNGVDIALFNPTTARTRPRPSDLPAGKRMIGFLGVINYHLDIELLVEVATAFPDDLVVIVGKLATNETAPRDRQQSAFRTLQGLPNVRILGFKARADLPAYLDAFDVCLIPFLQNPFNREADPLKFYEYFALGKAVVSTPVPVAERYAHLCQVAASRPEFLAGIDRVLRAGDTGPDREARLTVARSHSWEALLSGALRRLQ